MPAVINPIVILISTALLAGVGADVPNVKAAHNTTVELTCVAPNEALFPPAWVMNKSFVLSEDGYTTSRDEDTGELIGTLIINGNHSRGAFHVYCTPSGGRIMHNITLTIDGRLPYPENIRINESNDFLVIQWDPPYSAINAESSTIQVDPHITQYTVYIVDSYTGNYTDKVNITETSFRRNTEDKQSCPMYCVTAWNSGGEGDMSAPLPHIPTSIATEDVDIHSVSGVLDIHLNVTDPCAVRIPNSFLVTVMSADGVTITTVQHQVSTVHVTTIHITLPQNVDECNLIVSIRMGNSAGMSSPTEIAVGCQTTGHSTVAIPTITSTGRVITSTGLVDQKPQGDDIIIYIAIGSSVGAVVIVATSALLLIVLWKCKRNTKEKDEVEMHHNQAYETVTRMNHSSSETKVPTDPCPAYGVVGACRM